MAFSDSQNVALRAKLRRRHVKTREHNGAKISYIEGWHAIAEANRIFGFDNWDRQTLTPSCVWSDRQQNRTACCYSTKVRITVRAGGTTTVREGIGSGFGYAADPEVAHEMALKAAETDATKRALATFGNSFGLALYDREQSRVTKPRSRGNNSDCEAKPLQLTLDGKDKAFARATDFVAATLAAIERLGSFSDVYRFWFANLAALTELHARTSGTSDDVQTIIDALKERARALGLPPQPKCADGTAVVATADADVESCAFLLPKEKRLRDKAHLEFVASQPCLVCGRRPAQAHHLRFAQARAMSLKVSDEYTVPLCNTCHDSLHRTGDERAW
jgi:DNA recombination protein Rad52